MATNRNRELLKARLPARAAPKRWHARYRARRLKRFDSIRFTFMQRREAERG